MASFGKTLVTLLYIWCHIDRKLQHVDEEVISPVFVKYVRIDFHEVQYNGFIQNPTVL